MRKQLNILAALMVCVLVPAIGFAQRGPGGPDGGAGPPGQGGAGGGRGGRGGGGGVAGLTSGLAAIADLQGELKASNEEWLVVGPLLQKLIIARQAAEGIALDAGTGGVGGGRGGGGGNDTFGGPSNVATGGRGGGGRGGRGAPGGPGGPGGGGGPGPTNGIDPAGGQPNIPPASSASPPAAAAANATPTAAETEEKIQIITVSQALTDLQTALNEPSTPERQLKDLLAIVRAARAKAAAEVKTATEELQQTLTTDQIALLVSYGYLQ